MPTEDLYVSRDARLGFFNATSWSSARDATSASTISNTLDRSTSAVGTNKASSKYHVMRSFFAFDTSGITTTVNSATLRLYGYGSGTNADIILVKLSSGATGSPSANFVNGDFDAIQGFSSGQSMDGNVTVYSSELSSWSSSGYNSITLNAAALSDIKNNNSFNFAIVEYDTDFLNSSPTTFRRIGMHYVDFTSTSRDPFLRMDVEAAATDTPQQKRNRRRRRRSKGAKARSGFSTKHVMAPSGGSSTGNGFGDI
tara:strand:+ start:361 stop:1125 length:765 start_codon:yes stop_codon:yes gene_type:complete